MTSSISESIKRRPQENDELPCFERKQKPHRICMNRKGEKKKTNWGRKRVSKSFHSLGSWNGFSKYVKNWQFSCGNGQRQRRNFKIQRVLLSQVNSINKSKQWFFLKPNQPWFEGLGGCCAKLLFLLFSVTNWCAYKQTATQKTPLLQLQRMLPFLGQLSSASVTSLNFWEDPWILNQKIRTEATQYQLKHVFVNN